jgi:hypothetical protein
VGPLNISGAIPFCEIAGWAFVVRVELEASVSE